MKLQPKPSKNGFLKVRNKATGTLFYTSNALEEAWKAPNWSLQNVKWLSTVEEEGVDHDVYSARLSNGEIFINFIWTLSLDPDDHMGIQIFWFNGGDHQPHGQLEDSDIYDCETGKPIQILLNEYDNTPHTKIKRASKDEILKLEEENEYDYTIDERCMAIYDIPQLEWLEEALIQAINEEEEEQIHFERCPKAEAQIEEAFSDLF